MRNVRNGIELAYGNSVQFRMTEDPTADIPEGIYVPDARPGVGQIVSRGGRTCHIGFDAAIHCFGDGPAERMPLRTRNPTDEDGYAMVAMSADQVAFGVTRAAGQICATDRASAVTYGVEDTFLHPGVVGEITQIRSWQTIESVNHITPDATCRIIDGVPWCYFGDFLRIEAVPHVLVDIATGFGLRCGRIWNSGGDLFCWRQEWANDLRHCNSNLEYCPLGARAPAGVDLTRVRSLGVGRTGLCAVMWDGGGLRCASEDYNADRTFQDRPNFRPVGGLPDDLRVYRSNGFTDCVVSNAGEVFCWGSAGRGLFEPAGISGTSRVEEPVQIPGLSDVVDVAVDQNICALRANGSIVCWGRRHMPCDDHYGTRECGEFYTGLEEVVGAWPL
ncbi:MAG: hypothetical protein DRJ42_19690 [Deltaproteobacteria bacterium]|nr:MAG: hypothetical protein DRJ42_19690 [Deltaproteobacteria bacterium]